MNVKIKHFSCGEFAQTRMKGGFGAIAVIIAVAALALILGGGWYVKEKGLPPIPFGKKQCTTEAKLCPDGSSVSRTGPNCEFAACPETSNVGQETGSTTNSPWIPYLIPGKEVPTVRVVAGIAAQIGVAVAIDRNSKVDISLESLTPLQLAKLGAKFAYPGGTPVSIMQSLNQGDIPGELKQWTKLPQRLNPDASNGTLAGKISIGPICPVETMPPRPECMPTPETYASREFLVLSADKSKTIASFHASASGNYSVSVPPGVYTVASAKTGIGFLSKDLPSTVTIKAGQTTTLNIDVDTGIR